MTKLQKYNAAKNGAIKGWEERLDMAVCGEPVYAGGECTFCELYKGHQHRCSCCPIRKAEGEECDCTNWWGDMIALPPNEERTPHILAILMWLHSDDLKPLALEA